MERTFATGQGARLPLGRRNTLQVQMEIASQYMLIIIGATADGANEMPGIFDGYR